jgi:hypothetical protein
LEELVSRKGNLQKLISEHQRRLQVHKEQQARQSREKVLAAVVSGVVGE